MGLTSEKTLAVVQRLFDKFFDLNALLDRHVYLLDIKWNLLKYQDYVHHEISHKMPLLADEVQNFGSLRGDLFYRGSIAEHKEDYSTVTELTQAYVIALAELEKICGMAIKTAWENEDMLYEDFLRDFEVRIIAKLIKQAAVFFDAIKVYEIEGNLYKWNKDFTSYIIDKEED